MTPLDYARTRGVLSSVDYSIGFLRHAADNDRGLDPSQCRAIAAKLDAALEAVEMLALVDDPRALDEQTEMQDRMDSRDHHQTGDEQ